MLLLFSHVYDAVENYDDSGGKLFNFEMYYYSVLLTNCSSFLLPWRAEPIFFIARGLDILKVLFNFPTSRSQSLMR